MRKIKYYFYCLRWLSKHRYWQPSRQKFKAMEKDYQRHLSKRQQKAGAK